MATLTLLPTELLLIIAELISQEDQRYRPSRAERDLSALARTNWRLHDIANPILYRIDRDEYNSAAVQWAIRHGRIETLEKALVFGLDLNPEWYLERAREGFSYVPLTGTSIYSAVCWEQEAVLSWLLDHGLKPHYLTVIGGPDDDRRASPLFMALEKKLGAMACRLIDHGANLTFAPMVLDPRYRPPDLAGFELDDIRSSSAIHIASKHGLTSVVKHLVQHKGIDINLPDSEGETCLHYAFMRGEDSPALVEQLVQLGADVNANRGNWSPLHSAIYHGMFKQALALIDRGADTNQLTPCGRAPLHICTWGHPTFLVFRKGRLLDNGERFIKWWYEEAYRDEKCQWLDDRNKLLERLIKLCPDINEGWANQSQPPFAEAIVRGSYETMRTLIKAGADVNRPMVNGVFPIRLAYDKYHESPNAVGVLIENHVRLDSRSNEESPTVLQQAIEQWGVPGKPQLLGVILGPATEENISSEYMDASLEYAVKNKKYCLCKFLIEHGAKMRNGLANVLADAVAWAEEALQTCGIDRGQIFMEMLLNMTSDFNEQDALFRKALENRNLIVAHMVLNRGMIGRNPGSKDPIMWLSAAASWGDIHVLRRLLKGSPDINGLDSEGEFPLSRAVQAGHRNVVTLLLEAGADAYMSATINNGQERKQAVKPIQHAIHSGHVEILKDILRFNFEKQPQLLEEDSWGPAVLADAPYFAELLGGHTKDHDN
ncbi:ankyrin repeat-containing domain protein [Hypoxylon sp. FL1857]|nr:ankyrin repeat-containing domain protein [Hypoxylon sp. FL1857]